MTIPDGQRVLLAWLDDPGELPPLLARNPGLRRLYLITPLPGLGANTHPAIRPVELAQRHELPARFAADQSFFSEGRVRLYVGPTRWARHPELCRELQTLLLQFTQRHLSGIALRATRGWHILANELCNLPLVRHSLAQLAGLWANDPVVIAGAGPSLDDTVGALKRHRRNIRLIACDGAWNTLTQQGIAPDLVVSTDDSHKVWRYFEVPGPLARTPVVALLQSCCHIARHHPGPVFFARNGRLRDQLLADDFGLPLPVLDAGLCCGHAALAAARQMGAGQIILTGFDLGYKNGRFHPKDQPQPYYHDEPPPAENRLRTPANDGGTIETELSMQFYRQEFERRIAGVQPPVINATAGGARIAGSLYRPLEATLAALPPLPDQPVGGVPLPPLPDIVAGLARLAQGALQTAGLPAELQSQPAHWRLICEAVNPALSTGVSLLLEDLQQNIPGAHAELQALLPHLQETRQVLLEMVLALAGLRWPRSPSGRALAFARPAAAARIARENGLELIDQALDPDQLPALWRAVAEQEIDTLIMEEGGVLPAAWSFPGLRCFNLSSGSAPLQAEHRVPGLTELRS